MGSISLLRKTVDLIQNYNDKSKIIDNMMELMTYEYGFPVVGIFELAGEYLTNARVSGSTKYVDFSSKLLGTSLSDLKFSIHDESQIFGRSVVQKKYQVTQDVSEFLPQLPVGDRVGKIIIKKLMKLYGVVELGAFPCLYKDELYTCFVVGNSRPFTEEEIGVLVLLSHQLASYLSIASKIRGLEQKYQFERDMMGILGHELRTPMTVAKGMSELLIKKVRDENLDKDYINHKVNKVYDSILKETELIETMLSASHVDNDKVNLQLREVDLIDILDYAINAFRQAAKEKGLKLIFEEPAFEIPKMVSDQARLQEVVNNIVSNAVKYTNKGHVRIYLELRNNRVCINVEDTGIGIPEDEIQNLGNKFYRLHQHLDDSKKIVRAGGTGLGLYVVKGILTAMGGQLHIISSLGNGSTFTVEIPIIAEKDNQSFKHPKDADLFKQMGMK